jgi:hypothetical protein
MASLTPSAHTCREIHLISKVKQKSCGWSSGYAFLTILPKKTTWITAGLSNFSEKQVEMNISERLKSEIRLAVCHYLTAGSQCCSSCRI